MNQSSFYVSLLSSILLYLVYTASLCCAERHFLSQFSLWLCIYVRSHLVLGVSRMCNLSVSQVTILITIGVYFIVLSVAGTQWCITNGCWVLLKRGLHLHQGYGTPGHWIHSENYLVLPCQDNLIHYTLL